MKHEELKALIAPYVLGAVSPEEEREVRSHVVSCGDCMVEAESLAGVATSLAMAVDEAPLPAGFADAVMAKVAADEEPRVLRVDAEEEAPPAKVVPMRPAKRWGPRVAALAAAAAVVTTIVFAAAFLSARGQVRQYEDALPQLVQAEGIRLASPDGAFAQLVPTDDGATLFAAGLDEAPDDRTYQLWVMDCEQVADLETCEISSAGTFDVAGDLAVLETNTDVGDYNRAAITVEPAGGSEAPTTDPVVDSAAA